MCFQKTLLIVWCRKNRQINWFKICRSFSYHLRRSYIFHLLDQKWLSRLCAPFSFLNFFSFPLAGSFHLSFRSSCTLTIKKYSSKTYFIFMIELKFKSSIEEGSVSSSLQKSSNNSLLHSNFFIKISLDSWSNWFLSCLLLFKSLTCIVHFSSRSYLEVKGWTLLKTIALSSINIHSLPNKSLSTRKN